MEQSIMSYSNSSQNKNTLCDVSPRCDDVSELFTGDSLLELCNSFWMRSPATRKDVQPYLRGCKWSPDGTCCLSVVNHDGFHIMELPRDLYEGIPTRDRKITLLPAVIHIKESGLVYDFCWYPKMNSHYVESCSWISTKINSPIQMWDAYNGSLRCSYRGFNAVDEMEPALSVTFINQGQRIVGGYKNCLRTFDVERPGREFLEHKIKSPASCFATYGNLLAVGSWNTSIKLFSILDNGTYRNVGNLHAHTGGITHLQFTPDGTKLVSGARKDHNLCVWDVRYHRRPLNILKRSVSTNQRIYFDISSCGRYLVSGGTDGVIRVWDNKFTKWTEQFNVNNTNQENATFRFRLHRDCCNSISIHPSRPILATGSGQFHFLDPVKVLEFECDRGTNNEVGSTIKTQSASSLSSSDEEILEGKDDVHKTKSQNDIEMHIQDISEKPSNDDNIMDSIKVVTNKNSDQALTEGASTKTIELETNNDEPPTIKYSNWTNDCISTTDKEISDTAISRSIPILDTCNLTPCNSKYNEEEPPIKRIKLNTTGQASTEESNIGKTKIDTDDKTISEMRQDSQFLPTEPCNVITTQLPLDSKCTQCSTNLTKCTQCSTNLTKSTQCSTNLTKLDEADMVLIKKTNPTGAEDVHKNTEPLLSGSEPSVLSGSDSQFPTKLVNLREIDKSPTKLNVEHTEEPSNGKRIKDSAMESDDDEYNDINENKMKYSSYAENNLSFWWIAKIFDR